MKAYMKGSISITGDGDISLRDNATKTFGNLLSKSNYQLDLVVNTATDGSATGAVKGKTQGNQTAQVLYESDETTAISLDLTASAIESKTFTDKKLSDIVITVANFNSTVGDIDFEFTGWN